MTEAPQFRYVHDLIEHQAKTIGASGLAMTHELTTQLRGEAGKRQVENARIALAENGGGTLGVGEASMAIHIFEKAR